ncbi:protein big brother-like [Panonychus citri]|uniref:protein big brother-like n=1 Tax=Panonychus citri TaxID=50023 RepID=UPI00230763AA|nr:protein big brother-like [Panonychus citri]
MIPIEQLFKYFTFPKVVPNQKDKFQSDPLFCRLSRESEIQYVGYKDRSLFHRKRKFINEIESGTVNIVFVSTAIHLQLILSPGNINILENRKVEFRSSLIFNGVCVQCKGWIDLEKLEGIGCLEYDHVNGEIEDTLLKEQIKKRPQENDTIDQHLRTFQSTSHRVKV